MAIKIKAGQAPRYGRITMPKGSYLPQQPKFSNPSTAADGALGGGGNDVAPPPLFQFHPEGLQSNTQMPTFDVSGGLKTILQSMGQSLSEMFDAYGQARTDPGALLTQSNRFENRFDNMNAPYNNPLLSPEAQAARKLLSSQSNALVGQDVGAVPPVLTHHQISQILSGMSRTEQYAVMAQKGYVRSYQAGVGEIWIKGAPGSSTTPGSATSGGVDARGRPEFVDPTQLERGERVVSASGTGYTGGADYTNPAGETVSQYAVTIPGQGDRWKYKIKQDRDGNWVRVYYRTFGRQNKRTKARNRAAGQAEQQPAAEKAIETHQLVNLRADFG